jgi:hypothetical protein
LFVFVFHLHHNTILAYTVPKVSLENLVVSLAAFGTVHKISQVINSLSNFLQKLFHDGADPSKIHNLCRALAVALGALHTYAAIKSQSMNADGIAYLDIGDAYFRADWANAINPVWSPLYSWILGLVNFIFESPMQWEFPTVQIVNFLIYLFALACFEFMWRSVHNSSTQPESHRLSEPLWWTLGYLLFAWISLSLIQIWSVTPDMLMAGLVYLAAGLIAKIRAGDNRHRIFLSLGLILGLGYLSKTFMFSVALIFLALAWLIQKRTRNSPYKTLLAVGVFLLVSLPFILLISNAKGKLTIGEAGTVTFLRYVNGMPFPHWRGDPASGVVPKHPSRVIHESPAVYEFGEPVGGTYPITLDPSYWYEGIEPRFDLGGLLARLLSSSLVYAELFLQTQGILVACVLALYVMRQKQKFAFFDVLQKWALVIPAVIAFGLYATVLVEGRYVGVFVLLFWTDILANIQLPDAANNKTWLNVLSGIAALGLLANIAMFNVDGFKRLNPTLGTTSIEQTVPPAKPLEVAQTLKALGLQAGDKVGVIGYAYDSFWARLARVKITAEMSEAEAIDDLWRGNKVLRQSVLRAFASAGVNAVVAEYVPEDVKLAGWHRVGKSNYYIYVLSGH